LLSSFLDSMFEYRGEAAHQAGVAIFDGLPVD
jgi:hypothetical protein